MPGLNACLNSASALLLILGYIYIRRQNVPAHKFCMLSATATSTLFLICYITYHLHHGSTKFQGTGWVRQVYFTILISHTFLAIVQVPLILSTLSLAFRGRIAAHKRLARVTWPIWYYVSITGVIIYWMLYRIY
jgi:putative membrane protein